MDDEKEEEEERGEERGEEEGGVRKRGKGEKRGERRKGKRKKRKREEEEKMEAASSSSSSLARYPSIYSITIPKSEISTSILTKDELAFIQRLINAPKRLDKPIQSAFIEHLGWETSVLIKVGTYVVRTLGWDIYAQYTKYNAMIASEIIISRFEKMLTLMPYITKIAELMDAVNKIIQTYEETRLLLDSIIKLFPLECPRCSYRVNLSDKDLFFKLNLILYMNRMSSISNSSSNSSSVNTPPTPTPTNTNTLTSTPMADADADADAGDK